jgi:uncharacterized membrane protein YgcG
MMTMSDEISTPTTSTKSKKPSRRLVAIITASVLVLAGGITLTSVAAANAAAEETARQCTVALKVGASAAKASATAVTSADAALEAVKSIALPTNGWTSTDYAARPGVEAVAPVDAVPAVEASEGVEATAAVAAVDAVPARASGAEQITTVTDERAALAKIKIGTKCAERDEAAAISELTAKAKTATAALDTSAQVLVEDFAAFQTEETARIAAEIEAARIAAEIEAARVAAEAEAARVAAEAAAAAARAAAQRPATQKPSGGGKTGGGGGSSSGGAPAPRPPSGGGGGQVGPGGGNGGVCWTVDGNGSQIPAAC